MTESVCIELLERLSQSLDFHLIRNMETLLKNQVHARKQTNFALIVPKVQPAAPQWPSTKHVQPNDHNSNSFIMIRQLALFFMATRGLCGKLIRLPDLCKTTSWWLAGRGGCTCTGAHCKGLLVTNKLLMLPNTQTRLWWAAATVELRREDRRASVNECSRSFFSLFSIFLFFNGNDFFKLPAGLLAVNCDSTDRWVHVTFSTSVGPVT